MSTVPLSSCLPALLSVQDIATLLGCSPRTIWRLRDRGAMPAALRVGGMVRWRSSEIATWIEQCCPLCRQQGGRS